MQERYRYSLNSACSPALKRKHSEKNKTKSSKSCRLTFSWRLERNKELQSERTFHVALEGLAHYSRVVFFFCWPFIDIDRSP